MEKAAPAGTASFGWLPLIKGWIKGVEVLGIQLVGENAQPFAEALEMDDLPLPQELDGVPHVGVVGETKDVVVGHPSFLFWCDAVRTTFWLYGRQKQLWA